MAVMGTTPHVTKCENCGRAGLHKTVVCVVLDSTGAHTSEYHYFGSDCASKIVGKSEKDVEKDADDGDRRRGVRMPKPLKPSPGQLSLGLQYSCGSDWVKERFAAQYFATVSQYGKKPRYEPGQGMLFGGQETAGRQAPLFGEHGRWNEQEHPRASAGQSTGGQFVSKEEAIQQGVEHATKQGAKTGAQAAIHGLEHYSKLPDSAKAHFAGSVNYQDEVGRAFHKKQWSGEDPPEISHEKPLFEFHGEDGMIGRVYKSHDGQYIANLHDSEAERTIQHATKTPDLEQAKALARKFAGVKDEPEKLAAADLPSKSTGKSPKDMDLKELYAKRDEYTRNRKESFENERSKLALEMEAALKKLRRIKPDSPNRKQAEDKIREIKEKQSDWAERINDGSYRETEPHHAEINRRFKEKSDSLRQSTNLTGGAPAAAQGQPEKQGVESVKSDPTENKPTSQSGLFSDVPAPAPKPAKPAPVDNTGGRQDALFAGLNAKPGQMNLFDDAGVPDDLLGKKDKFSAIGDFSDFDVFRYAKPRHSPGQLNLFGDSETSGQQGRLFGDFGITPKNPTGSSTIEPVSKPATEAKPHVNFGPLFSQPKPAAEKPSEKPADSPIPPSPPPLAAPKPATVKASTESKPVHSGHSGHTGGLFDESAHPRWQKGDHEHHGGQFAPKGEVSKSTEEPKPEEKPEVSDQSELPAKESSTALVRHAIDRPKHSIFSGVPEETKYISNTKSISVNALKGADAIWHHQGDPRQTIFNAGQRDAHEHTLRQAKEIEAAQNAGYRLVNHRAGKYGTLYVFEKDGRILTERGAKALVEGTGIVDIPDLGDNMKHRHEAVKQLANFIDSLPESTRNDLGALVNALNRSPLGQHLKISRDDHGMLRLEPKGQRRWYLFEPSTGHDEDGNFHQNLESSLPRFLETIQNMASREIPEGEGGWATHERESKPIVKANGSSPEPAKEALGSDDSSFPSLEGKSSQFAFFDPARHGGVNAMLQLADDVDSGKLSVEDFKAAHALYHENKDAFIEDLGKRLNADQMKKMATRLGSYHANGSKKGENAKYIHERLMGHVFDIGEGISNSYSHSQMMDVNETGRRLAAHVAKQTPESLASHVESVKAKREGQAKQVTELEERLANPKTVNDWTDLSAKLGGYDKLSTEQKIGFDDAIARDRRERDGKEKATVKPVTGTAGQPGKFTTGIVEGHHQKHNKPTFTVTVDERMGEDAYREALGKARALGGNYVNAKVARMYRATPGFQFFDRSAAEQFEKTLKGETVDRSERLQQSRDEMLAKMSEKLAAAGMLKQESGEEAASAGRKENTRRQSEQAANARAQANRQAAFGKTLQRIGEHLASGKSVHLNGIRHGTHVEALDNALRDGKYQLSKGDRGGMSYEDFMSQPHTEEDIAAVSFPHPTMWTNELREMARELAEEPGLKNIARDLGKWGNVDGSYKKQGNGVKFNGGQSLTLRQIIDEHVPNADMLRSFIRDKAVRVHTVTDRRIVAKNNGNLAYTADGGKTFGVTPGAAIAGVANTGNFDKFDLVDPPEEKLLNIRQAQAIETLRTAMRKLKGRSNPSLKRIGENLAWRLERHDRLKAADITNGYELRAALREYLPLKQRQQAEDPVAKAERELKGKKIPGFFPTPRGLIDQMLDHADIKPGMSVLEPSAGKGDILDAITERHADDDLKTHAIEPSSSLREILGMKGHNLVDSDFMQHSGQYDRIVMNPPFERGQDMEHVKHAFSMLKPGGRLVAVMAGGNSGKRPEFDNWVFEQGGTSEQLPEGSFSGADAFRQTGVNTKLVIMDKPGMVERFAAIWDSMAQRYFHQAGDVSVYRYGKPKFSPGQLSLFDTPSTSGKQGHLFSEYGKDERPAGKSGSTKWEESKHPREESVHDGKRPGEFAPVKKLGWRADAKVKEAIPGTAKVFSPERIVGAKIESPKDLVQVAQMYRDPRYETLRYFMVKDGVVVGHNAYTSKHVSAVGMKNASERIANDCKAVGADSFYLLHNHPSGNPTPSREDHEYTQNIMEGVKMRSILSNSAPPKFMGHVIIDHNKAAIIPPDESRTHYEISVPNEDLMKTDSEYLGQEITNPDALAKIATANRPEKGRVTVIVCDTKLKTRAILDVALSNLKRPSHHVAGAIRRMTREFGGNMVFGVLPDGSSDSLSHHIKEGVFLDVFDGSGRSQRQNIPDYFPIKHLWNSKNIKTFETARERLSSSHWSDTSRYSAWSPQTTRTGRRAWRNVTTGEVRYQDKEPESAQAKIQRPTPPKGVNPLPGVPAQAQQAARPPAPAAAPKPVRATVGSLKPSHEVFMLPGKEAGFGGKPGPMKAGESAYFMGRSKFGGGFIRLQLKNGQEVHLHSSRFGVKKKSLQDPKPSPLEKGRAKAPAIHDIHAHDFASQKHGILVKSGKDGRGYLYHGGALYRLNDNEYGGGKLKASPMKVRERIHRDAVRLHMLNGGKMSPGNAEFYGDRLNDKSRAPKEWNPVKLAPPGSKPAAKPAATGLKPPTAPAQAVKPSPVVAAPPADPAAVTPTQPDPSPAPAASPAPPRAPDPNMTEFQKATGLMPSAEQSWKDGIEAMKARRRTSDARMEPTGSPTTSAQPAAQATASIPSTTHELKHPTLGSNQRMKRWYNAGRSSGSQEFSSPAQMALYDYGANESYKMRGGRNKTGDRAVRSIDSHQLASQLGIPHEKLYELAMRVHNDVRQQMRGFKDGEHRMLKPTSLVDAPAAPAAAPVAPAARANPSPAPVKPAGPSNRELAKINQVIEKQKSGETWADEGKDKLLHAIRESFPSDNPNLLANIASDVKHFHKKHMEDVDSHNSAWHSVMNQSGMPKDRRFRSFRELKSAIAKGADSQSAGVKGFDEILQTAKSSYPWIFRGDEGEHESQLLDFMLDGPKEKNPVHHSDVISKFWDSRQPDYHDHVNEINEGNAKHQWWEPDSWYTPESFKTGEGSDWGTPFSAESDSSVERFAAVFHRRRSFPRGHFSRSGYNFASTN